MTERTLEELEAEVEAEKKILNDMYESDQYTLEQRLEQSKKTDQIIVEVMKIRIRIDKMIKEYSLSLLEGEIGTGDWLVIGNQDDFKFFKKNKPAFLNRLLEIASKQSRV